MGLKNSSTALFELIKSLKKSEKRHIKLYATKRFGEKKLIYLELFDIIDNMKEYDESIILKKCPEIKAQQLPNQKKYLHDLILSSLSNLYAEDEIDDKVKQLLRNIKILHKKRLLDQCISLLNRAKKLAYRYEKHLLLLEIIEWEITIIFATADVEVITKSMENLFKERKNILNQYLNASDYLDLFVQMALTKRFERRLRNESFKKSAEAIISSPLLKNDKKTLSSKAFFFHHNTLGLYYYTIGNFKESYKEHKILLTYLEKHLYYAEANMKEYTGTLYNVILSAINLKKYDDYFDKQLQKLKQLSIKDNIPSIKPYIIELTVCVETGNFKHGLSIIEEIHRNEILQHKDRMQLNELVDLEFQICYIYYANGMYQEALVWLNGILNRDQIASFLDAYCCCRIMQIIIHFEMKNYELASSLVRSTYRFLLNKGQLYQFEQLILSLFRAVLRKAFEPKELIIQFKEFYDNLIKLDEDEQKGATHFFDYTSWLESKLTKKPFASIVKQRFEAEKLKAVS